MNYKPDPLIKNNRGIHIGDMVTTYHKGYFKVIGFQYYNNTPGAKMQCIYQRVADSTGQPCSGKPKSCAIDYIRKVDHTSLYDDREFEEECLRLKYCALNGICSELEAKQDDQS